MINVLYEDNHVLVVEKPVNVPVQEDASHDKDLLTLCKEYLKEKYNKPGNVYLGLVHRLDRPVGGVMVFAKTSKAASRLSESVRTHQLEKEYLAILDADLAKDSDTLFDYLVKNEKTNTVTTTDASHGKPSNLSYDVIARKNGKTLVHILLGTGRSHQIRVQFSSRGYPLLNDQRYNRNARKGQIALYAYSLSFPHPTTKQQITVTSIPAYQSPWNLFEEAIYERTKEEKEEEKKKV